jgi:hypothetical protein
MHDAGAMPILESAIGWMRHLQSLHEALSSSSCTALLVDCTWQGIETMCRLMLCAGGWQHQQ